MKVSKVIAFPLLLAGLWALLAFLSPTTTYHLAPLLVAAAVPFAYRSAGGASRRLVMALAAGGGVATLVLAGVLAAGGAMEGPSLLPTGGALLEAAVGVAAGAVLGLAATLLPASTTAHG